MLARVPIALAVVTIAAAVARGGVPFQVNTTTPGNQTCPRIAAGAAGNFVVTWSNSFNDTRGQRFGADLTPIGSEFVVHPVPLCPAVSTDAAGNFVLAWTNLDGDNSGVMARRFDTTGAPLGGAFQVNTYTTGRQWQPAVAVDASGAFTVVWQGDGENEDPISGGIFAQRFDAAGEPAGGEFHVNTYTTMYQVLPAIAARPNGDFVVVWAGRIDFGQGILGQRFDAAGTPVGGEFSVNEFDPTSPAVAMADDGGFLIAWEDTDETLGARAYDANGIPHGLGGPVGDETQPGADQFPAVASDGTRYLVAWTRNDTFDRGMARRFAADGAPLGSEFPLAAASNQVPTAVTRGGPGELLVGWTGLELLGDTEVFVRRLRPGRIPGKRCTVKAGATGGRRIVCQGLERVSPNFVLGDPVASGATLRVVTSGATPSDQTFTLPAGARWTPIGAGPGGYRYSDVGGADGPVRTVLVKRTASGVFQMKATIAGTSTTPPPGVQVVPPDSGSSIVLALDLMAAEPYCTGLGTGQGGGVLGPNDATTFRARNATDDATCP